MPVLSSKIGSRALPSRPMQPRDTPNLLSEHEGFDWSTLQKSTCMDMPTPAEALSDTLTIHWTCVLLSNDVRTAMRLTIEYGSDLLKIVEVVPPSKLSYVAGM